mgnify:CR=1 FL=1
MIGVSRVRHDASPNSCVVTASPIATARESHSVTGNPGVIATLALALGRPLVAIDLPGHGQSPGPLRLAEAAQRLAMLAHELQSQFGAGVNQDVPGWSLNQR